MAAGVRDDSVRVPSLRLLCNNLEEAENDLHDVLNDSIDEGDLAGVQTHGIYLKAKFQNFKKASKELESRYRAISSKWESHQTRCSRQQLQSTVNQRLSLLSEALQRANVEVKFSNLTMDTTYDSNENSRDGMQDGSTVYNSDSSNTQTQNSDSTVKETKALALEKGPPTSSQEQVTTKAFALETVTGSNPVVSPLTGTILSTTLAPPVQTVTTNVHEVSIVSHINPTNESVAMTDGMRNAVSYAVAPSSLPIGQLTALPGEGPLAQSETVHGQNVPRVTFPQTFPPATTFTLRPATSGVTSTPAVTPAVSPIPFSGQVGGGGAGGQGEARHGIHAAPSVTVPSLAFPSTALPPAAFPAAFPPVPPTYPVAPTVDFRTQGNQGGLAIPGFNTRYIELGLDKEIGEHAKFGGKREMNFQYWAETFLHKLSLFPHLTGGQKLHSLVAHTAGKPREIVERYFLWNRTSRADEQFNMAWQALKERYGLEDLQAKELDSQIGKLKSLPVPLTIESVGELKDICMCVLNAIKDSDGRDRLLLKYNQHDGLTILASKLPMDVHERWKSHLIMHRVSNGGLDPTLSTFIDFLRIEYAKLTDPFLRASLPKAPVKGIKSAYRTELTSTPTAAAADSESASSKAPARGTNKGVCPIHQRFSHTVAQCKLFKEGNVAQKREWIRSFRYAMNVAYGIRVNVGP